MFPHHAFLAPNALPGDFLRRLDGQPACSRFGVRREDICLREQLSAAGG